jgi:SOS response regulatory protein OraA/RecX
VKDNNIPAPVLELLDEILKYYNENNWLVVKKYVLKYIHPSIRKNFSTRNLKTKKHIINKFEKEIIEYCNNIYNIKLELRKEDTHEE